jgi:protocatechuate 3,4-dioxygenase beta subunit
LTRELTEGPYYFDVDSIRSDIREDRPGTTLRLGILVQDSETCAPIPDAVLDVWHCDAEGSYSRVRVGVPSVRRAAGGGPGGNSGPTDDETYLRGAHVTNAEGVVEFVTIYPGCGPCTSTARCISTRPRC